MQLQWKWTIPNILSLIRIAILPVFVFMYILSCNTANMALQYAAFVLLAVSGLTDCFDGWIARKFHQESEIGKLLDPLADKLTQVAVMICLATQYMEFLPLLVICVVKESLQGLGGLILFRRGTEVRGSNWYGKVSTAVFYVSVAAIVLWRDMPTELLIALVVLIGVLMLFAFVRYFLLFISIRKEMRSEVMSEDITEKVSVPEGSNDQ